jgi:hypothetical protein
MKRWKTSPGGLSILLGERGFGPKKLVFRGFLQGLRKCKSWPTLGLGVKSLAKTQSSQSETLTGSTVAAKEV